MKSRLMHQLTLFPESVPNEFRKHGQLWQLVYAGKSTHQTQRKGLNYLAFLLAHPNRPISALMLEQAVEGRAPVIPGSAGEALFEEARVEYGQRIDEIQSELAEAKYNNDLGRQESLREEWEALKAELNRATGLGNRCRQACEDLDLARRRVKMAISRAMDRLERDHPLLWTHLNLSVRTGRILSYEPEQSVEWLL